MSTVQFAKIAENFLLVTLVLRYLRQLFINKRLDLKNIELFYYNLFYFTHKLILFLNISFSLETKFKFSHICIPTFLVFELAIANTKLKHKLVLSITFSLYLYFVNNSILITISYYTAMFLVILKLFKLTKRNRSTITITPLYLLFIFVLCINHFIFSLGNLTMVWHSKYMNYFLFSTFTTYLIFLILMHANFRRLHFN